MAPYNDFISEADTAWPRVEPVASEVGRLDNVRAVLAAGRQAGLEVIVLDTAS
ncbi:MULTISPECIES: hypothetical protein [unclassified Streptomyces]|uniref:hypothetical protein n=1 Tax=unclassified Streptomyces TaxID=2593676 RepID=UPI003D946BCE